MKRKTKLILFVCEIDSATPTLLSLGRLFSESKHCRTDQTLITLALILSENISEFDQRSEHADHSIPSPFRQSPTDIVSQVGRMAAIMAPYSHSCGHDREHEIFVRNRGFI
jgi:hypothetical protein